MICKYSYICSILTLVCVHSYSQKQAIDYTNTTKLSEVIITATRTERQLSSIPLPATLISKKKIITSGTVRLNEILNEQTGIISVSDESGFEGVQIQGISSEYIMILIDGVPLVGRSAGNFDLSRIAVGNIKQIEIVKGPSSSLYGSEALGGVINIITEKPTTEKLQGAASYRVGSFTQQDINLDVKQQIKKLSYSVFANRFSSNGYDLNANAEGQTVNPFENQTINGKVYYDFNDKLSLFTSGRFFNQNQDTSIVFDEVNYEGDSKEREWNAHARLDHKFNEKLNAAYELYYTNYTANERLASPITEKVLSDSNFNQKLLRPEIRGNYTFEKAGTITAGIGWQYDELDRTFFDEIVNFNSQYVYAQYDVNLAKKLNIIVGTRFDNHSEYNNQFSPKLALQYKLTDAIAIKSSIGYGFKAPDFRQLYFDFTNSAVGYTVLGYNVALDKLTELQTQGQILNVVVTEDELQTPLEAESSIGYNLGFTYKRKKWNTEINFFRNDFKNLIDTRIIARKTNGQNVFSYVNFNEIYTTGLEVNGNYKITPTLNISTGYQLLYAFDKEKKKDVNNGNVFVRNPETNQTDVVEESDYFGLINRSRHNANFKIYYDIKAAKINLNIRILYRSKYAQFDTNGNGIIDNYDTSFIDGYTTTNIAASKVFFEDFTLQIGANNLFNYKDDNIPTLPGIQGYMKLNYEF